MAITEQDRHDLDDAGGTPPPGRLGRRRTELHTEIGTLRNELHTEMGGLHGELHRLRSEVADGHTHLALAVSGANAGLAATFAAPAFAYVQLT